MFFFDRTATLLDFKSHIIAEQMTLIDNDLFQNIEVGTEYFEVFQLFDAQYCWDSNCSSGMRFFRIYPELRIFEPLKNHFPIFCDFRIFVP